MSTVADVAAAALAGFFCLQQAHPIIISTETASVEAKKAIETALFHRPQFPLILTLIIKAVSNMYKLLTLTEEL